MQEVRMQRVSLILAMIVCAVFSAGAVAADSILVLTHVRVIDATGTPAQPDMTVTIRGQHIAEVAKSAQAHIPAGAHIVDARGKYLIPGLWDMHVHTIFGDWLPRNEKVTLPLFVANGITGVRDMGGDLDVLKVWRSET